MDQTPTVIDGIQWSFQFLAQIAFQWVPAVVVTVAKTGQPGGVEYPQPPIGAQPATAQQMAEYIQTISTPGTYDTLVRDWGIFVALSIFVSLLLVTLIIYCVIRILQIRHRENLKFAAAQHSVASHDVPKSQLRWKRIVEEASSEDEQKIRLAILEADIMLNELLDTLGYRGETMADKMRQIDRSNFNTIDAAWEAHRARNAIAHQGSEAKMSLNDSRRIIGLYERVFREFRFIE
jgi:cell division protein FtsL